MTHLRKIGVTIALSLALVGPCQMAQAQAPAHRQVPPSDARRHGVLVIGGRNQTKTYNGRSRYVLVSGRHNYIQIRGTASILRVTGNDNHIRVYTVAQIEAAGTNNHISYYKAPGGVTPRIYARAGNWITKAK